MSCALCHSRKEKRFCPALHERICPQCCGEQREVTLDCPSTCEYLQQARKHERPRAAQELDRALLFLDVDVPERFVYEREPLLAGLTFGLAKVARGDRELRDQDAIAALASLARTYQTRVKSGLLTENKLPSLAQQAIVGEMERMVDEYRKLEAQHLGHSGLKDSEVLQAFVFLVRLALGRTSGRPRSRAFVEWLEKEFPAADKRVVAPQQSGSIIIP